MDVERDMDVIYIDAINSGVSGDMFLSSFSSLFNNTEIFAELISVISKVFPDREIIRAEIEQVRKNGIFPYHLLLDINDHPENANNKSAIHHKESNNKHSHDKEKHNEHYHDEEKHNKHSHDEAHHHTIDQLEKKIKEICIRLNISKKGTTFALKILEILAIAEGEVHNTPRAKVHFHEIGSLDTIIDICGITYYLDYFNIFQLINEGNLKILSSPISIGGGTIRIAHGVVSVPAPATTKIIEKYSIDIRGGPIEKELCTPTGAAIIAGLIENCGLCFNKFLPEMKINNSGYGTGNLTAEGFSNILIIRRGKILHETNETNDLCIKDNNMDGKHDGHSQKVSVIETTVDDVTGEVLGNLMEKLLELGAMDVNFISAQLKKNRPGVLIRVISPLDIRDKLISTIISYTGTLGVRYREEFRKCLKRKIIKLSTEIRNKLFEFRVKLAFEELDPEMILNYKAEYDDLANISRELNLPIKKISAKINAYLLDYFQNNKLKLK